MSANIKYPLYYYLAIALFMGCSTVCWIVILGNYHKYISNKSSVVINYREYKAIQYIQPINPEVIVIDSIQNRRIVGNLVNIALKNQDKDIFQFAEDLKKEYQDSAYQIVYLDSVINRLQIKLPSNARDHFKREVKNKMSKDSLLVWDEMLFENGNNKYNILASNKDLWYLNQIDITKAWQSTIGNKKTIIAVVDNGFDLNHPELNGKAIHPYNVIEKNTNVNSIGENHGTHVASIAAGNWNMQTADNYAGICPSCTIMPVKVEDKNGILSMSYVIDAILYAIKNKADVINLSLGVDLPLEISQLNLNQQKQIIASDAKDLEVFWNDLFKYAYDRNVICVIAAGNDHIMTGIDPFQRSKYAIKVGAVSRNNNIAKFSNFGNYNTIYAPGEYIKGAKQNNQYEFLDGTSMATPIVSGIIGLIKAKYPQYSSKQTLNVLMNNTITENNIKIIKLTSI